MQKKYAFVTPIGKFGLAQAPTHFQQLINEPLKVLLLPSGYLDDIFVFDENTKKHFEHLRTLFDRLQIADLQLKRKKCDFLTCQSYYLGHLICEKGVHPLPEKSTVLKTCTKKPKEVRQMLTLIGYYFKFTPAYAGLVQPPSPLVCKAIPLILI